jgi:hypothetical protein
MESGSEIRHRLRFATTSERGVEEGHERLSVGRHGAAPPHQARGAVEMTPELAASPDTGAPTEARSTLMGLAQRKVGKIPPELLADHVLAIYADGDWHLMRAALEAILRRAAFARRDDLRVIRRPPGGAACGEYRTGPPRAGRPYRTRVDGAQPLRASCDCPDFQRASLGLCKHVLVVLDDLASKPRRWAKLLQGSTVTSGPRLAWDSIRPLHGEGDWLERVRLQPPGDARGKRSPAWRRVRQCFTAGADGELVAEVPARDDVRERAALLRALELFVRARARTSEPVDPALAARITDELHELARREHLLAARRDLGRALDRLARPLFPYQREGVERFLARGRLLLADDMGLGKTTQAAAAAQALFRAGLVRRGLLVVPAPLKTQWVSEWAALGDVPIKVVDGTPADRAACYARMKQGFLVANYEQVLRDVELMQRWKPELVVLDEAQRIKNWATRTAQVVKTLRTPYRLVLTGTPMENRLEELASIMDWVDSHALEPKWRLVPWHTQTGDGDRGIRGARHLDTLRARLAPALVRRRRTEVLDQLPPRSESSVPVPLTEGQREAHDELTQPIARLMQITERRPLSQEEFLRLMSLLTTQRVIANGLAQLDFVDVWPSLENKQPTERRLARLHSPKLLELREIVRALCIEQGRSVVIFSQWRRMLQLADWAVSDLLEEHGLRAVFFTGREGQRRRTANLVALHDDPATRILFASDAGGVGLNLQRAASACVNLELPWNPAVLEQRIGRIWRLGQTEPVQVYHLVSQDCIEARIAGIVGDKRQLFEGLFDGETDTVDFAGSGSFLQGVRAMIQTSAPRGPVDEDADETPPEAREQELVAAADESEDAATQPPLAAAEVGRLFAGLRVETTPGGGLRIEAEAEVASTLAALLDGLAAALRAGGAGGVGGERTD